MLGVLFTLPAATSTLADVAAYSSPWFNEWLLWAALIIGVTIGVMGVGKLISVVVRGAKRVLGGKRRGRGRRR